jgi:hypothetical protein
MKILVVAAVAVFLLPLWAHGEEAKFDSEKLFSELEKQLRLSKEELDRLKPELEKALESKSKELKKTIDRMVEEGYVELESAQKDLEKASEEAKDKLDEALNSEQVTELKAFLEKLDEEALEEARREIIADLERFLELTGEQVRELEPVIREQLEKLSDLLSRFMKDSGRALEEFRRDYEDLSRETKKRLEKALDPSQLEKLEKHLEETGEKIQGKLFPGN